MLHGTGLEGVRGAVQHQRLCDAAGTVIVPQGSPRTAAQGAFPGCWEDDWAHGAVPLPGTWCCALTQLPLAGGFGRAHSSGEAPSDDRDLLVPHTALHRVQRGPSLEEQEGK